MTLDEGCAERGCPMHDERETKGVVFIRKEWVGFTEKEREDLWAAGYHHDTLVFVERLLKGKNT